MVAKAAKGRLSTHTHDLKCSTHLCQCGGCYRQPRQRTNRIAAFQNVGRPVFERLSSCFHQSEVIHMGNLTSLREHRTPWTCSGRHIPNMSRYLDKTVIGRSFEPNVSNEHCEGLCHTSGKRNIALASLRKTLSRTKRSRLDFLCKIEL